MVSSVVTALHALGTKQFVREKELLEVLPISRSTLLRMVKSGAFPAPRYLNQQIKYWLLCDVLAWAEQQDRGSES